MSHAANCVARLVLVSAALLTTTLDAAVCRPEYRNAPPGVVHTACKPPNPICKISHSGLSNIKKAEFLDAHNNFRSKVAMGQLPTFPKAADMHKLVWDDHLAEVAQAMADLCTASDRRLRHDKAEERFTGKFEYTGQNLAWGASYLDSPEVDVASEVKQWFDEYKDFSPFRIAPYTWQRGKPTGHFTQVIWAATTSVGCGFTQYTLVGDRSQTPFQKIYVCNYGPGGNIQTKPVYEAGKPCSKCPPQTTCEQSTGLCASPHDSKSPDGCPSRRRPNWILACALLAYLLL